MDIFQVGGPVTFDIAHRVVTAFILDGTKPEAATTRTGTQVVFTHFVCVRQLERAVGLWQWRRIGAAVHANCNIKFPLAVQPAGDSSQPCRHGRRGHTRLAQQMEAILVQSRRHPICHAPQPAGQTR